MSDLKTLRTVLMGTPSFAVPTLELLKSETNLLAVYTQPDKPVGRGQSMRPTAVKKRALELGCEVRQPEKASAAESFEELKALNPDVIVVVAYGQILKTNVLELARYGCVNIHSSLLPRWRGAAPIQRSILAGDTETGVTTMRIVKKLDAGDILMQKKIPIGPQDTAGTIHDALASSGATLVIETLKALTTDQVSSQIQDENQVTYAEKLTKEEEWLDLSKSAQDLDRQVRAFTPWPGTCVETSLGRLKIKSARAHPDLQGKEFELFERNGMLLLACQSGSLELIEIQWDGKKPVDTVGFMNGLRGRGEKLPLQVNRSTKKAE